MRSRGHLQEARRCSHSKEWIPFPNAGVMMEVPFSVEYMGCLSRAAVSAVEDVQQCRQFMRCAQKHSAVGQDLGTPAASPSPAAWSAQCITAAPCSTERPLMAAGQRQHSPADTLCV